jgi:transposase
MLVPSGSYHRQRHNVENFFQRIKVYKRISTRYDKLAITFLNFCPRRRRLRLA